MPKIPTFGPPAIEGGVWHADKDGNLEQVVKPPLPPVPVEDAGDEPAPEAAPVATGRRRSPTPAAPTSEEPV